MDSKPQLLPSGTGVIGCIVGWDDPLGLSSNHPEILNLIAGLDEFKGVWWALGNLAPERLSALRRVATIESIGSSTRIEGSKLSDPEVELLLSNLEIKSFATRDEQEVAGYAETIEPLFQSWEEICVGRFSVSIERSNRLCALDCGFLLKPISIPG